MTSNDDDSDKQIILLDDEEFDIEIEFEKSCEHLLRVYEEAPLPAMALWRCILCDEHGKDDEIDFIHTADDIDRLINEGNEI